MTTDNFSFNLQNRLIQTSQTGGQWYSDASPFSIPWFTHTYRESVENIILDACYKCLDSASETYSLGGKILIHFEAVDKTI
jgi:hypothetical protein